jgi:hypothetical protein
MIRTFLNAMIGWPKLPPTPAEIEADRRQRRIDACNYDHVPGAPNMVIHPGTRDKLSCMFCPKDLPLLAEYRCIRGGSFGGGWDTVSL